MRLLKIADQEILGLDEYFDDTVRFSVEEAMPRVENNSPIVEFGGENLEEFDAVYADIPKKNAIFGRVLLEAIEQRGMPVNYSSTAFFSMAKKNYLHHVLKQKDVASPNTAVLADEKASRSLEKHLRGPLQARKFNGFHEVENTKIESVKEIGEFAEGVEYGDKVLIFSELSEGEKYRCLVTGDEVVSLKDESEGWKFSGEKLSYSNLPGELEELACRTASILGAKVAEVLIRDGEVVDVEPNPELEQYKQLSGKNTYKAVAEVLKSE